MGVKWTEEQQKVISLRDRNILVSAAAGSGKTAVLVERILSKITDPEAPVDIDRLLIMTFTRAAAGEMKERISSAIESALYEDPDNEHLQRQSTLLHTAQITTIDGFCAYIIRNYFHATRIDNWKFNPQHLPLLHQSSAYNWWILHCCIHHRYPFLSGL